MPGLRFPPMDRQLEIYRSWPAWKRLQAAAELYKLAREIIRVRESKRDPRLGPQDIEKRVRSFFR